MKKKTNRMLAAILICGASLFTACTTDNADNPSVDPTLPTITPEPTTDQLEVKVTADMPMAVLSEFSENMVCWRVKNPSEGYQLNISTKHKTECMAAYYINKLVPKDGYFYYYSINWNNSYDLKQPCRYMGTWNCEIITKGENRKQNASKYFREFLQESVAEAPFKVRFNVAERSQGETDVMKNLVTYVSSLIKEGTRKRRTIDNEARDLGIESFTITWYSDDPDVTTEYTISGKIKEE